MRFSRVSIIGTLAAAALALLVVLPVLAREGVDFAREGTSDFLRVTVQDNAGDTQDTRLGATLYVSNDTTMTDGDPDNNVDPNGVIEASEVTANGYSRVEVFVTRSDTPSDEDADDRNSIIQVRSDSGRSPTVVVTGTGTTLTGTFYVIPPVSSGTAPNGASVDIDGDGNVNTGTQVQSASTIEAQDGDTITITALGNTLRLVVDGEGPVFSDTTPRNRTLQSSASIGIGFTVTDSGSGLRTDNEDPSEQAVGLDGLDADGIVNEPLSLDTLGSSFDINMTWEGKVGDDVVVPEREHEERRGDRNWIEEEKDHSYSTSFTISRLQSATYSWQITATDRVGNTTMSDSSSSRPRAQAYTVTVDDLAPEAVRLFAGIGFDSAKDREKKSASSILVVFNNEDDGGLDALDTSTLDADDFNVVGNTVTNVIHPNEDMSIDEGRITDSTMVDHDGDGDEASPTAEISYEDALALPVDADFTQEEKDALQKALYSDEGCESGTHTGYDASTGQAIAIISNPKGCIDTRNRIYLTLGTPLDDDATPDVHIVGTVRDEAGNPARLTDELETADRLSPTITVSVSGDVTTDGRALAQETITVNIGSGERLSAAPGVWLASFDHEGTITSVVDESASSDGTNAWEAEFDGEPDETMVGAVLVHGRDRHGNTTGTKGWDDDNGNGEPDMGEELDLAELESAGFLAEFDDDIPDAVVTLSPDASGNSTLLKTDSTNPFIKLSFGEGKENTVEEGDVRPAEDATDEEDAVTAIPAADEDSFTDGDGVETKFDSYSRVELTNVTLDGEDVTDEVERLSSSSFDLAFYGLAVGDHTLEFTATDTAGNAITDEEVKFEVLPRGAYEVDLRPGWNLVSFPGEPRDPAIDSVLPADHSAIEVLTYEAGLWIASVREPGQPWEGEVTDIDGQHAYWINSTGSDALSAVLIEPGTGEASRPPAFQLVVGWNLIPVTDLDQGKAGTTHDDYFTSMLEEDFVRAYVFNAQNRRWERLGYDDGASNGQGVWVYSRSNVILVP